MADPNVIAQLKETAHEMRKNLLRMCCEVEGALHIGGDLSMADMLTALYAYKINVDPKDVKNPARDRFILSKGHCAAAMYIAMAMRGFFPMQEIYDTYGQVESRFGMHPCKTHLPGVEASAGSLGHGLPIAVGMALAARIDGKRHRVYTIIGDGESQEGSNWEAAMAAAHYKLGNVVALIDRNRLQLDGPVSEIMEVEPFADKWAAFGWDVVQVDGHDMEALVEALDALPDADSAVPTVIICDTVKGKGVSFMENEPKWHAGSIDEETLEKCLCEIDAANNLERGK